jgi:hypothetical protein
LTVSSKLLGAADLPARYSTCTLSLFLWRRFPILSPAASNVDYELGELGWIAGAFWRFTDHLPAGRLVNS